MMVPGAVWVVARYDNRPSIGGKELKGNLDESDSQDVSRILTYER